VSQVIFYILTARNPVGSSWLNTGADGCPNKYSDHWKEHCTYNISK